MRLLTVEEQEAARGNAWLTLEDEFAMATIADDPKAAVLDVVDRLRKRGVEYRVEDAKHAKRMIDRIRRSAGQFARDLAILESEGRADGSPLLAVVEALETRGGSGLGRIVSPALPLAHAVWRTGVARQLARLIEVEAKATAQSLGEIHERLAPRPRRRGDPDARLRDLCAIALDAAAAPLDDIASVVRTKLPEMFDRLVRRHGDVPHAKAELKATLSKGLSDKGSRRSFVPALEAARVRVEMLAEAQDWERSRLDEVNGRLSAAISRCLNRPTGGRGRRKEMSPNST